jgi:hypothetical protein
MTVFGKTTGEYMRAGAEVFIFVATVATLRLGLSLAGGSSAMVEPFSGTWATVVGVVYLGVRVHTLGFGGYKQLLPLVLLTSLIAHWIAAAAVGTAILMDRDNIYSVPEYYALDGDGKSLPHLLAHLLPAPLITALLGWALAAISLLAARLVTRIPTDSPPPLAPSESATAVEQQGNGAVVDEGDLHHRPEDPLTDREPA